MMITVIGLEDKEDSSTIVVSIDSEDSGALVYGTNHYGDKVVLTVDARLLKQFCNDVSKAIQSKAQKTNECGEVKNVAF
jgi:hypothetical protein